jgi:phenylacetate-CoA ligase
MRGYYLSWWRYDKETDKRVEEALERDYWTENQWNEWRQNRLSFILHRAVTRVPYYRDVWSKRRRNGDKSSYEYLENWDILEKQTLRERGLDLVANDCNTRKMFRDHTSGTTGTSLDIWMTRDTVKYWYALSEARWRRWYGVSKKDRWAILGGQLITPAAQNKPPFWVWNSGLNQLYMSSYHLAPGYLKYYIQALKENRIRYLVGYSSALYSLAQAVKAENTKDIGMDVVISNAEPLYEHQKELISDSFGCPVRETYGMAEMAAAASECSSSRLHQWPEAGSIEKDQSKSAVQPNEFICTGLVNPDMPLIRYRVGDSGTFSSESCSCGRTLPLIEKIEGRNDDLLYTADGRRVGRLDPVFKDAFGIAEAQIVQRSLREINVKYVPAVTYKKGLEVTIADRIRERMGDVNVTFENVPAIPRTAAGKFRAVVCELPIGEKAIFTNGASSTEPSAAVINGQ